MSVVVVVLALITSLAAFFRAWSDHTELTRKLHSLKLLTLELQKKLERRGQLAAEIAHEIKNPITAIQCSAQTLDLMLADQIHPELRKSLHYIREYSDYLLRLLSDFLEVSRYEAGAIRPRPEVLELTETVDGVVNLLRSYALQKHITLTTCALPDTALGWADPRQTKQILFNLVHNGIKFTPEHGTVRISVHGSSEEQSVTIAVHNTGEGIPADQLDTIFDPYARFESNQPQADTGVGLGLGLCRSLVELNGGKITVQSTPEQGTTFTFTIPKAPEAALNRSSNLPVALTAAPGMYQPLRGHNFLLVDEDLATRDAIARLIQAWGGVVDQVAQATEAIEAITAKSYDAVMVDNTMDGLNGYELATLLRDNAQASGTTIIVATKSTPDQELAQECGADRTLEKPLKGDQLLHSLLAAGKWDVTH